MKEGVEERGVVGTLTHLEGWIYRLWDRFDLFSPLEGSFLGAWRAPNVPSRAGEPLLAHLPALEAHYAQGKLA